MIRYDSPARKHGSAPPPTRPINVSPFRSFETSHYRCRPARNRIVSVRSYVCRVLGWKEYRVLFAKQKKRIHSTVSFGASEICNDRVALRTNQGLLPACKPRQLLGVWYLLRFQRIALSGNEQFIRGTTPPPPLSWHTVSRSSSSSRRIKRSAIPPVHLWTHGIRLPPEAEILSGPVPCYLQAPLFLSGSGAEADQAN
jgi:hypothetical protein